MILVAEREPEPRYATLQALPEGLVEVASWVQSRYRDWDRYAVVYTDDPDRVAVYWAGQHLDPPDGWVKVAGCPECVVYTPPDEPVHIERVYDPELDAQLADGQ